MRTRDLRSGRLCLLVCAAVALAILPGVASAKVIVKWDFSQGTQGYRPNRFVEGFKSTAEGLAFTSTGIDPWIEGPAVDLPADRTAVVTIRMRSKADPHGELFYGRTFQAGRSVRFTIRNDGKWHDYRLVLPEMPGPGTRFRLDPATGHGDITVASISIEVLPDIPDPPFAKPGGPRPATDSAFSVVSGDVTFEHYKGRWGNFVVRIGDTQMAAGYDHEMIGVLVGDEQIEWLDLGRANVTFSRRSVQATIKDGRGVTWRIGRAVRAGKHPGTIVIETQFEVDKDSEAVHLPWLTLFPGLGSFGQSKQQGLFAGLEYLADEPSSSKADIETTEHIRRVPDPAKVTLPLMAVAQAGKYVGLIWEPSELVAPVFDSPDTIYNSGAHVMALSGPAVGRLRFENKLAAHTPAKLKANTPIKTTALIIGGTGSSIIPAVKRYVAVKGIANLPRFSGGFDAAVVLLAHGWLDSEINHDGLFRHAVWGTSFAPTVAPDAALLMDYLAKQLPRSDRELRPRLKTEVAKTLDKVPEGRPLIGAVSHVRPPVVPLVFGGIGRMVRAKRAQALSLLNHFDDNGIKLYRPGGKTDYGRTHFAKHANGLAGADLVQILEAATLSADTELTDKALALLDKQTTLYANTVPRGAQTWEVPLHTPDILASANMTNAYTLGYVISGERKYLEQARYWAWTGVPFVYLYNPTDGQVGPYATIAVLGATNWKAPVWLGRPVQWCGLVYCSALHMLSDYDDTGPWEQIAKGITAAGLQMSWPVDDRKRQGLLPDFYHLRDQISDGPAINPGTVQAHLPELHGKGKIYDLKRAPTKGWFLHAPCAIRNLREQDKTVSFELAGWASRPAPYYLLISGVRAEPDRVQVRGDSGFEPAHVDFKAEDGLLIIALNGPADVRIR